MTPHNVRRVFRKIIEHAGLAGRGITPHSLRRTAATLVAERAGERAAADLLGHVSEETVRQFYIQPNRKPNPATATILTSLTARDGWSQVAP